MQKPPNIKNILVTGEGFTRAHISMLEDGGFRVDHRAEEISLSELRSIISDFDAYILGGMERLTDTEFALAKRLKIVSFVGTGCGSFIDMDAARRHSIKVCNTPAVMAPAVAETTIGLLLGLRRKLFEQIDNVKLSKPNPLHTEELGYAAIGILGMGSIGSYLAKMLRNAFGVTVMYHSRSRKYSLESELGMTWYPLDVLLGKVDVLILLLPTESDTKHILNSRTLGLMKKGGILINTAGANLVDPEALREALNCGNLGVAGFDGYYVEPLPTVDEDPHGLLALPNSKFAVTPHSAAKTPQSWSRMLNMAVENILCLENTF
jgi:glyoxylate reductase